MQLEFLGVGEAFDPSLGNTSLIVHSETKLLIDCGYVVPKNYFERGFAPEFLDAIYITHFHADHTYGLPGLLSRLFQEGRTKPLTIIGQPGVEKRICETVDFGYPNIRSKFNYPIRFVETTAPYKLNELLLSFAETDHPMRNFAIRIERGAHSLCVSGDGAPTKESIALMTGCKLIVHEAYRVSEPVYGHASAEQIVDFIKKSPQTTTVAFVHIDREERRHARARFLELGEGKSFELRIPEPGEIWTLKE